MDKPDSAPDYLLAQQQVMEALGFFSRALDKVVDVVRDNARDAMLARRHASQLQNRVAELEDILHAAPTIAEVEAHAPGWLDRVRTALAKEAQP